MQLQCTVQEDQVWFSSGAQTLALKPVCLRPRSPGG
jgi:hypothetical protein